MSRPKTDPAILFWRKVDKSGDCWMWTAAKNPQGYGWFGFRGKMCQAHRVSYLLNCGEIPDGMFIDHKCHEPACVRPDHLRVVTAKQNMENRSGATRSNVSGYRGVAYVPKARKWMASASHKSQKHYGGLYATPKEAAEAARLLRLQLFTHSDMDKESTNASSAA